MSFNNKTQRTVLGRYSLCSAFRYIPMGQRDAGLPTRTGELAPVQRDMGAWRPALLPQTSSASLVRQHPGLDHPLKDGQQPPRPAQMARAPSPCPRLARAAAPRGWLVLSCADAGTAQVCFQNSGGTRGSSYGNNFGECALELSAAGMNTGLPWVRLGAPVGR